MEHVKQVKSLEEIRNKLIQQVADAEAVHIEQRDTIASHEEDIHRYASQMEVLQLKIEELETALDQEKSRYETAKGEAEVQRDDLLDQLSRSQQTIKGLSAQADEVRCPSI